MDINLKKHKDELLFVPLGGASEIGMNVNLYHLDGKWLMIDLGLGFASNIPGVDMIAPDISFIKSQKKNLLGLVVTHIHEDHLGAIQHLWEELRMPIYTSNLAAHFLRAKLSEYPFAREVKIITVDQTKELNLNPFRIEFIGLTHSVPEMNALMIKTSKGNILHSGDWKFDPNPVVGIVSEKEKIKEYGDKGDILALVCDSTNALSPGHSKSEGDLFESLKGMVKDCKGLVGVTTFASNIARIQTISEVAKACNRKVVLAGFSLKRIVEVGKKAGYFSDLPEFISDKEFKFHDKDKILVISTGCQGEPMASTMKIATDAHRYIKFREDDTIIFSSKIIPGNEKSIFNVFNLLAKKKINVLTEKDHFVHVSGHPNQEELKEMYELARPHTSIPVHGEFIHLRHHCKIANDIGVNQVVGVENGCVVKLTKEESKIIGFVESGYLGVDGKQLIPLDGNIIRTRRKLQLAGLIIVSLVIDSQGNIVGHPYISAPGAFDLRNDDYVLEIMEREILKSVKSSSRDLGLDKVVKSNIFSKKKNKRKISNDKIVSVVEKQLRTTLNKICKDLTGKRPILEVVIQAV